MNVVKRLPEDWNPYKDAVYLWERDPKDKSQIYHLKYREKDSHKVNSNVNFKNHA